MYTTVRVETKTKDKLEGLKAYPRESFDGVLNKLISLIPEGDDEGKYSQEFRASLLEAEYDTRTGKVVSLEQLKKELKL